MARQLFGIETEYALSVIPKSGSSRGNENAARELLELAKARPHVPGLRSSGLFLGNGSRFYVDCGAHPELATPECTNPWDAVRYVQAGERMLFGLTEQLARSDRRIAQILLSKANVDYLSRSTWGCHESYLHRVEDQTVLSRQIIPHLVSRIIFCGAGGFDNHSPGIEFVISPRVPHLNAVVSGDSTNTRGIFHTRDEPLSDNGNRRLHILCGESLSGETGAWLKVATTALVVTLIDAGKRPGDAVALVDPLTAMQTFSADPSCKVSAKLASGRTATVLEIQYHYLEMAEAHAGAEFMPSWSGEVCKRWRAILDRLQHGPANVARILDWAIKLALFEKRLQSRNTTFEQLAKWTPLLIHLGAELAAETDDDFEDYPANLTLDPNSPLLSARTKVSPVLEENGLKWSDLEEFLKLRLELFEIDARCNLVGEKGIFAALDHEGVLDHRIPGVENISHAMEHPPSSGRARLRGECIRRLAGKTGRFAAEWDGVFDVGADQWMDLSDPFCTSEKWTEGLETRLVDVDQLFRVGRYTEVLEHVARRPPPNRSPNMLENLVMSFARLGRRSEALGAIETQREQIERFLRIGLQMSVLSNGFIPALTELNPLIAAGDRLLEESNERDDYSYFIFHLYKAYYLLHTGHLGEAEALFVALLGDESNRSRKRMYSRTQCNYGELLRRLGRKADALQAVEAAYRTHQREGLSGDLADHSLPMLAKLTSDLATARRFLDEAEATARLHRNHLGLARILCLRGRRLRTDRNGDEVAILQRTVPALSRCKVARRIVARWDDWTNSQDEPIEDYWGL